MMKLQHQTGAMKKYILVLLFLLSQNTGIGQIFKKQPKRVPSAIDNIHINEHFRAETLDTVYNILHEHYGLNIIYDTPYCNSRVFTYWYSGTLAPLALEITTRENGLRFSIDSNSVIHIKTIHPHRITPKKRTPYPAVLANQPVQPSTDFALAGHIVDDSTGEPLAGATVFINGTSLTEITDSNGYFKLPSVPWDTATVTVAYTGYIQQEEKLSKQTNISDLVIGMQAAVKILQEAVITANKETLMKLSGETVSMVKLTPAKLAEIPNVGEKDIMRTFQLMPGVSAANESSSGLYVRGGTPDQNLVIFDGFTVYQVDHLYGFFSAFNANALSEVSLYKGGFEAKYGGRLSSVTDIAGKEGSTTKFNVGGEISLLSANIFAEVPVTENLSLVVAGRRSWRGPIYNWIFNSFNKTSTSSGSSGAASGPGGSDGVTKAKSYFYDINTRLTFKPTKKDVFTYSFFNGTDDLNNSFTVNTPSFLAAMGITLDFGTTDVTNYSNTGMSMAWIRKWNKHLTGNTTISYSNYLSSRDRVTTGNLTRPGEEATTTKTGIFENNNLKDLSLRSDYEWSPVKWTALGFGVFGTNYSVLYNYSQNDTSLLLDKKNYGTLSGGYIQNRFRIWKNKISITPGVRLSYFDVTKKNYIEPRASLNYAITKKLSFKSAYGKYYQFANRITREDISAGSTQFWVLADGTSIPVSSSIHYISGLSYETRAYLFSVEGYYKTTNDITQYTERYTATSQSINYNNNFYTGSGYSRGVEFLAQKTSGKFTGWVSYTLGRTTNNFAVYSTQDYPADQDVKHEFKIVTMYKYKHWDFAATWIYASGKPYTAPGGTYSVTLLDGTTENYFTTTSKNTLRLPDYHRMDVSVNYHFYNEAKKDVGYIGLSLFNVYNRQNVWYKQFTVVDNSVVETNVNYLSFTPNLTLSLKLK